MAAEILVTQDYQWPDKAELRSSVRIGDLFVVSRCVPRPGPSGGLTAAEPDFGVSLPWLQCGPLLARGMLRQIADPLGFSAGSGVFQERTTLVLDGALQSSGEGALLMPLPELCGVFYRSIPSGGNEYGALGRLPLGAGAAAEGALLVSRPVARTVPDDWFFTCSPFPGGEVTDVGGRLVLDSPRFSFSFAAGGSSAKWAAPGAFASLWVCGRAREIQGAVLLCGATPGYRAPDGDSPSGASRISATIRLGSDRRKGTLETGCTHTVARPCFSPHPEIATRTALLVQLSRDFEWAGAPISVLLQADQDIGRDPDGVRTVTSRCVCSACASFDRLEASGGVNVSNRAGVGLFGSAGLKPSRRLRISIEARGERLGASSPLGSLDVKLSFEKGAQGAALKTGIEDCPLTALRAGMSRYFRLSLSCFVRQRQPLDPR